MSKKVLNRKERIVARQKHRCNNKPGSNIKGLEEYKCPLWLIVDNNGTFDESGCEIDHITEQSVGRNDDVSNLQALCPMCHKVKALSHVAEKKTNQTIKAKPAVNKVNKTIKKLDTNNHDELAERETDCKTPNYDFLTGPISANRDRSLFFSQKKQDPQSKSDILIVPNDKQYSPSEFMADYYGNIFDPLKNLEKTKFNRSDKTEPISNTDNTEIFKFPTSTTMFPISSTGFPVSSNGFNFTGFPDQNVAGLDNDQDNMKQLSLLAKGWYSSKH